LILKMGSWFSWFSNDSSEQSTPPYEGTGAGSETLTKPVRVPLTKYYSEVFIDLETTGFGYASHITQFAANGPNGTFNRYVKPKIPINDRASEITGIVYEDGQMFVHDQPVQSVTLDRCLEDFFSYLGNKPCILVAHNAFNFDAVVLVNASVSAGFWRKMESSVVGFMDTLVLFRKEYPGLPKKHSLKELVKVFLKETYDEHNALADTLTLQKLVDHCRFDEETKRQHTCSLEFIRERLM